MADVGKVFAFFSERVKSFIVIKAIPKVHIDEKWVHLNYRLTSFMLVLFVTILSFREFWGDNIQCLQIQEDKSNEPVINKKIVNRYCFISTTFTVPYNEKTAVEKIRDDVAIYTGGQRYIQGQTDRKHHAYYQWVPFFLFFQALLFYLPHSFWRVIENKKMSRLIQGLEVREIKDDDKKERKIGKLAEYLVKSKGSHYGYAFCFVLSEFLNLAIVFLNMYLTDVFLGREFSTYGPQVIKFLEADPEDRMDPMAKVFPRVTKCIFRTYGPSGTIQRFDTLCVLPSNIVNEKIFTFLWFWFVLVALIMSIAVGYRIMTLISNRCRMSALNLDHFSSKGQAVTILNRFGISDWILLRIIRLNVDTITFTKLVDKIYDEI